MFEKEITMKVHSAVIKLVLRTNKILADGRHPIMLRVSYQGMKEKSTGYGCFLKEWDQKNQQLKPTAKNAAEINQIINTMKERVVSRKLHLEMQNRKYTPAMLLNEDHDAMLPTSEAFVDIMNHLLNEKVLSHATQAYYHYAYKKLAAMMGDERFLVTELTENSMRLFIKNMKQQVSEGTVYTACSKIAAVCNHAILLGVLQPRDYCFRRFNYSAVVRKANKKAYIDKDNLLRIEPVYLKLVTRGNDDDWTFRSDALLRLGERTSLEFALCFWLAMLKLNGSAPIDVALLKGQQVEIRHLTGKNGISDRYFCFDFKRAKTGTHVRPRIRCDRLARAIFEPFVKTAHLRDGYLFPIIQNDAHTLKADRSYDSMKSAVQYVARVSLKKMRGVCADINEQVRKINEETGQNHPLIDIRGLSCYNMRHSFAMAYLSTPGANVNALASLLARNPNTIATYITQLSQDQELIDSVADMGI